MDPSAEHRIDGVRTLLQYSGLHINLWGINGNMCEANDNTKVSDDTVPHLKHGRISS
jgi:hypothetical protein